MKSIILVLLVQCVVTLFASGDVNNYDGFKVWSVLPVTAQQKINLYLMKTKYNLDFWDDVAVGSSGRIMVAPEFHESFQSQLNSFEIQNEIVITDVESVIDKERNHVRNNQYRNTTTRTIDLSYYWSYEQINEYMTTIANTHFYFIERFTVANSTEGRTIYGVKFSMTGRVTGNRPIMFIDGGIHAREWITPMQVLGLIDILTTETFQNLDIAEMNDIILVPLINVDGYVHTHNRVRLWRKTRRPNPGSTCVGTDGNRNYDNVWNPGPNPCSETFGGSHPFSEPEVAGIRDIMHQYQDSILLYCSIHSYGNYLIYPWGHDYNTLIENWELHQELGEQFADAIRAVRGTNYRVGNSASLLYITYGDSKDYAATLGIPLTYILELPGGGNNGFDLPPENITDVVFETLHGFKVFGQYLTDTYNGTLPDRD